MEHLTLYIVIAVIVAAVVYLRFKYLRIKNMPETEEHKNIVTLTATNFQQQAKEGVMLVDFWAAWCMPCKMMAPILNEIAGEVEGSAKVGKVNVEEHQQLSAKFSVRNIPTLILFKNGREVERFVGVKPKDFLIKQIKKYVNH